jgi:chaperonin GroES
MGEELGSESGKVTAKLKVGALVQSPNIAKLLSKQKLGDLGRQVVAGYRLDKDSRAEWEQRTKAAIELALQVVEQKSFPWPGCANVKFPLLTIAALQFLARISLMTKGKRLVKVDPVGSDPKGAKTAQAKRISRHMSMQLTDEDVNWRDMDEQAKLAASIIGSSFKKSYYDAVRGVNISEHVTAANFVVDYFCKDIDNARRATHLIPMSENDLHERYRRGIFLQLEDFSTDQVLETNLLLQSADDIEGIHRPTMASSGMHDILEQHCWLDLDDDGYEEPYVVSVHATSAQVLRVVARYTDTGDVHRVNDLDVAKLEQASFKEQDLIQKSKLEKAADKLQHATDNHIVRIDPTLYFTRYLFIPSPDGGVYGLGLGSLLGPMNESVNTLVNQLLDAGTMAVTAGGFLGRGVKLKGGKTTFDPFEWKPVDSSGNDLRQNIFPLPVREPSPVLFQLLGMLIQYSEKLSGATDIMTGVSPGQNTPAETSRNTVEQGMMLFSGIYSRMHRSFTSEIRKLYELNRVFLPTSGRFFELTESENALLAPDDYNANRFRIYPAAGAEAVSQTQQRAKAAMLLQLSDTHPGFDKHQVMLDFLEVHDFENLDGVYPDPKGSNAVPLPVDPKIELEKAKQALEAQKHQDEMQLAIAEMQGALKLNEAKILELQAKATKEYSEAQGVDTGHQIALIEAQIGAEKVHHDGMSKALGILQKHVEMQQKAKEGQQQQQATGAAQSQPAAPVA